MNADILDNKFLNSIINTSVCMHMSSRVHTHKQRVLQLMSLQEGLQRL